MTAEATKNKLSGPSEMNRLIEGNLYKLYDFIALNGNAASFRGKTLNWIISQPSVWPNMIYPNPGTYPEDREVEEVLDSVRGKLAPPFWALGTTNRALIPTLEKNGLVPVDLLSGMSMELANAGPGTVRKTPSSGLEIIRVEDRKDLESWLSVVEECIFKGKSLDRDLIGSLVGFRELDLFLGLYKGQAVSTSMSFLWNDTAGFYNIATLPGFRKMGFAHALTTHAIRSSRRHGIRLGILHATKMAESLYSNIGFSGFGQIWIYWMQGKEFRVF